MNLHGKSILLTGATGGIGAEVALALSQAGARLLLTGRDPNKLVALLARLSGSGHLALAADLANADDRAKLVAKAQRMPINILINLAGTNEFSLLTDTSEGSIAQQLDMNLLAPITLCHDLAVHLAAQSESAIVNVGSILGSIGVAGSSVYCASKFGLRGFSEALRREYADTPLQVFYVAPRATDTAMNSAQVRQMNTELGTATDSPQQVASLIVETLQQDRRVRYFGWPERLFVRLNALFPALVDRALLKQLPIIRSYAKQTLPKALPKQHAFN